MLIRLYLYLIFLSHDTYVPSSMVASHRDLFWEMLEETQIGSGEQEKILGFFLRLVSTRTRGLGAAHTVEFL